MSAASADSQRPEPAETAFEWLARFEREHGRQLRVLHIGNIANNAYNNAKIQRARGIEADVACWDYYHVMGCPEWEDAEFSGDFGDPFFPDWWRVELNGYERPRWFAQGRLGSCQRYLLARSRGRRMRSVALWRLLMLGRWLRCRSSLPARAARAFQRAFVRWRLALVYRPAEPLSWRPGRLAREFVYRIGQLWFRMRYAARLLGSVMRTAGRKSGAGARAAWALARGADWRTAALMVFPRRLAWLAADGALALAQPPPSGHEREVPGESPVDAYRRLFPDRLTLLTFDDYAAYLGALDRWKRLFEEYDVVQAYATDPILPYLCGVRPYAAYEHGTLREIPFEDSPRGRLCALSYREAAAVFVTNSDVVPAVRRLGLDDEQTVFLPHAVDSDRLFRFADENAHLHPRVGGEVGFFSPSRQDWVDGDRNWTKGNDRAIRALGILRDRGLRTTLVLGEWGRDLDASKRLVAELDLGGLVRWAPALRKRSLWEAYLGSHAVIDQFVLPAMGGVTFEAMALGRRVITHLDVETVEAFFGERPPILAVAEPEEIADAMAAVIADPDDEAGLGAAARDWFARRHSADRIIDLQARAYRRILTGIGG